MSSRPRSSTTTWLVVVLVFTIVIAGVAGAVVGLRSTSNTANAAAAAIIGWEPGVTRGVPLDGPLKVYFSRGVDQSSVENAWKLTPNVPGSFTWSDNAVSFRPNQAFHPGSYYRLQLGSGARDDQNKPLRNQLSLAFTTGDALAVTSFSPASGTRDVALAAPIAVSFNHPMVALVGLEAATPNPPGWSVSISPQTAGHGTWLGTSTWVFHPDSGLAASSQYVVTVHASNQDAWGEALGKDLSWSFRTVNPGVVNLVPANGATGANPDGNVSVTFNQPMDHASTAGAFSLRASGAAVAGSFSWKGNRLIFHPSAPLDPTTSYAAEVASGARSANGQATLSAPVTWSFQVAPPPHVIASTPATGQQGSSPYVEVHFSANMNQASLDRRLTITPALSRQFTYTYDQNNGSGSNIYVINGDFLPSTAYTVRIAAGARDTFGRIVRAPFQVHFTTDPLAPAATLYGPGGVGFGVSFAAGRAIDAPVQLINVPQVHFTLVHTGISVLSSGDLFTFGSSGKPPHGTVIRSWTEAVSHSPNKLQNLGVRLANADGSPLAPGVYWLGAQAPGSGSQVPGSAELVLASNTGVTLKVAQDASGRVTQALVWVTSAATGKPVAGATVRILDSNSKEIATGTTDRRGLHVFPLSSQQGVQAAVLDSGGYVGMALTNWAPNVPSIPLQTAANGQYTQPPNGAYVYTDRPIYRPGQTVHFRAVVWQDRDGVYQRYQGQAVSVDAIDGQGHTMYKVRLVPDAFGSIHGNFHLPSGASIGIGQLLLSPPGAGAAGLEQQTTFAIAQYRKPEFLTTVSTSRPSYSQGQTIKATVQARYVFGAAVAGQPVTWTANSRMLFTQPPGWDAYQFGDQDAIDRYYATYAGPNGGQFGAQIAQGSGVTDDSGRLMVRLPADLSKDPADQTITIEATTTDINNQPVSGRVQVPVLKAAYAIGLSPANQVLPAGSQETVDVAAVSPGGAPVAGASLNATVYRRTYTSKLANQGFSSTLWQQVPHDTQVSSQGLTTDGSGKASFSFTPADGGDYYVVVTGKDQRGATARSGIFVYASAAGFSDFGSSSNTTISLQADRASYQVGQTAHIVIAAPFAGATALVTVERGSIRTYRVQHFRSNSPTIKIPITLDDVPNVYVTATLYRGWRNGSPPDWRYGQTELHIKVDPRRLIVHLSQDRPRYHPGDTVTYTVKSTDVHGRPVSAQFSLALVDTAVLALQDETNADILQALYGERPLSVSSSSDGVVSIDHLQQKPGFQIRPHGQGGGGGGGSSVQTFRRFADTGYWSANVVTNASGTATVHVRLPDNFTTWRLDARGVSAAQQVGQARLFTLSTQDIVLRPVTPRFFLQGDTLRVGVIVNNDLAQPVTTGVALSATGLDIHSARDARVTVPAGGERLVSWNVSVPESSAALLTFHATPSSASVRPFAVQVGLPVHPPLTDETVATAGQAFGTVHQLVVVPAGAIPRPGALTVQISAALTAGMGTALASLAPQHYESNDDVANRLLAAAALHGLPRTLTGLSAAAYSRLPGIIGVAAARLVARENADGGWAWFGGCCQSNVLITADAVQAFTAAGRQNEATRGRAFLQSNLVNSLPASERAHVLLVSALSGVVDRPAAELLYQDTVARASLDPGAIGDLATVLSLAGDRNGAQSMASELDTRAMVSATGAHWEGPAGTQSAPVAVTSSVLAALLRIQPNDPFVAAAARWLMLARQGQTWDTPRDSAQALAALAGYARAHEGAASYRYSVTVDGATHLQGSYTPSTVRQTGNAAIPVSALQRGGQSDLAIARLTQNGNLGLGPLYWVARLRYYLDAAAIPARSEGISVSRRYLDRAGHVLSSIPAGSVVQVELTISSGQTLNYLDLEDPLPAGLEAIDQSLKTSRQAIFGSWKIRSKAQDLTPYLVHTEPRDDRVAVYVVSLPPGTYVYTYLAQATVAGQYAVAPSRASEAFFPEVFGRSAGQSVTVR